jgi:hypothetical protein
VMALNLMSFLGLTGYFQDLIKGYAKVEGPLRDLVTKVKLPQPCTKSMYRHILRDHKLDDTWDAQHTKAFLDPKIMVTLEPILQGPPMDAKKASPECSHSGSPTPDQMGW